MLKKAGQVLVLIAIAAGLFGCSTTPRRREVVVPSNTVVTQQETVSSQTQADMDKMKQQLADQQAALAQSEAEKRALEDKLNDALATKKPSSKKTEDSYLK